ncbi:DUF1648 domain-containing protein [Myxococcus xanthus]|uniref:DUF1648 domain-containing protein n=1 Tax=Myxococcus xanthus TaxID=34 RepID=UPI00112BE7B0|nr:DUF1648 domain-containing protein [Myxococcus xanthus]QDE84651.1 hypothetical protein BHS07_25575 [Myxococcus xanthus]QDE98815.1 hypothetical protein BHS05_24910 [Myxococcus xanthus]
MKTRIAHVVNAVAIVAAVGIAGALYSKLPDPVPTHWNFQGQPDGFTPKPLGAFLGPAVMTGVWLLSLFTSRASARAATRRGPAVLVHTLVIVIIGVVSSASLLAAVKQSAPEGSLVRAHGMKDALEED